MAPGPCTTVYPPLVVASPAPRSLSDALCARWLAGPDSGWLAWLLPSSLPSSVCRYDSPISLTTLCMAAPPSSPPASARLVPEDAACGGSTGRENIGMQVGAAKG